MPRQPRLLQLAATGACTGTPVAYLIDPWLGVVAGVLGAIVVPLSRVICNPQQIIGWLTKAAAVPPAVTQLLISIKGEWARWPRRPHGRHFKKRRWRRRRHGRHFGTG